MSRCDCGGCDGRYEVRLHMVGLWWMVCSTHKRRRRALKAAQRKTHIGPIKVRDSVTGEEWRVRRRAR